MPKINIEEYKSLSNAVRFLSVDMVNAANSGHPGAPMGMADIITVLFKDFINFDPASPNWLNRDKFILSNGHASALLYSTLHLAGYNLPLDELKKFRQFNSQTPGHPEYGHTVGVETTTGPLGQGIANAVGMAIANKIMAARFGKELFNNKIYVTVGDGCLMEGISHEALELAGHLELDNLIILFDDNGITIDGKVNIASKTNVLDRISSYGFKTFSCDGHDFENIHNNIEKAINCNKPSFISFKTEIGYGSSKANTSGVHGSPLGEDGAKEAKQKLNWPHETFVIPKEIKQQWESFANKGKQKHSNWNTAFSKLDKQTQGSINKFIDGNISKEAINALQKLKESTIESKINVATRKASGNVLDEIAPYTSQLISGSADLEPSVHTKAKGIKVITSDDFGGNFIHYGVREHAMASIMNGLSLSGFIPVGGTFMCFVDYFKPALRLSALMGKQTIHVLTHDSIGLGEDGPTHQPIEHLAMLRSLPNSLTFRPADQVETAECWQLALENKNSPSVLSLSRQGLPTLRDDISENKSAKGAYIIAKAEGGIQGIIMATGSETSIAVAAHHKLLKQGINTQVVSMPCVELFDKQPQKYKDTILPPTLTARIAVEAATEFGWSKYIGNKGKFIGMQSYGASAPANELYEHFGITENNIINTMKELIK